MSMVFCSLRDIILT